MTRGFFAVGVYHPKHSVNVGTLWRTATLYEAAFVFTVGRRYKKQSSDTMGTASHIPMFHFTDVTDLKKHLPYSTPLVGVELDTQSTRLSEFPHPMRACYLLGAEDHGLPERVISECHDLVYIRTPRPESMNVAVAGSIIINDRFVKETT